MPSVPPREDQPRPRPRLWLVLLAVCLIVFSPGLWLCPAHATTPTEDQIKQYCESRPNFRIANAILRTALIAKCVGEQRRMHGYEPFSAGATPPAESAKKVDPSSAGTVLPVESPKKLDPGSAVPPVESVKKVDPSSVDAVPPVASTERMSTKKSSRRRRVSHCLNPYLRAPTAPIRRPANIALFRAKS